MEIKNVTELVLENVEKLLLEGRVENVKKKYPPQTHNEIDKLVEADPSNTNKYLEWAAKMYLPRTIKWFKDNADNTRGYYSYTADQVPDRADDEAWNNVAYNVSRYFHTINDSDLLTLKDNLEHFHKNPSKYEIKDINQFPSTRAFEEAVEMAKQKLSRKEMKETGVDKVYEDENFLLLMPKTHKASCRYGANTRWCVTMRGYSGYFENYFTQGPIFFLVDKRRTPRSYSPQYMQHAEDYWKVALHYRPFNGRLDQGGNRALDYARKMTKEEFLDMANPNNTRIDYWNVSDDNKPESTVAKYLAGPGRGQKQRSEAILSTLKNVMSEYTKKALGEYYDSLGDDTEAIQKLRELKQKRVELNDKDSGIYYKSDRLDTVIRNLRNFRDRLSAEDEEYLEWYEEQVSKAEEFRSQMRSERNKIEREIEKIDGKIEKIESNLENKKLAFYDKEKNVPMTR